MPQASDHILAGTPLLLDGGLATELERRGADLGDPLWSARILLEDPALIRQVHLDYFRAGAQVATSASYQASYPGFQARGLSRGQAADLMRLSVRLTQEARDLFQAENPEGPTPLVAASLGCYGAFLADGSEYRGDYGLSVSQLIDWHRPRLETLLEAGPDLFACETIPCLTEAQALVRLLEEYPEISAWLSFSCRDESRLCHGEPFVDAVALANTAPNVVAVGVNCTPPRFVEGLLQAGAPMAKKILLAYPNSGETWDASRREWIGASSASWADDGRRWLRPRPLAWRLLPHHAPDHPPFETLPHGMMIARPLLRRYDRLHRRRRCREPSGTVAKRLRSGGTLSVLRGRAERTIAKWFIQGSARSLEYQ